MPATTFSLPAEQRYFEDYAPGAVFEFGATAVTEAERVAFAQSYDLQAFHIDREAAAVSMFGGSSIEVFNQHEVVVMTVKAVNLLLTRPAV